MTILVGYASAHGSTREIAEHIGARLSRAGCPAVVRPLDGTTPAEGYSAFVLGSAVHNQRWLPEAAAFLQRYTPMGILEAKERLPSN